MKRYNSIQLTISVGLLALGVSATSASAQNYELVHAFRGSGEPRAHLIQARDGSFYGTTSLGGTNGLGTVFKMTSGGTLTTLHSFGSAEGSRPEAALLQAADGNFYGTTTRGGTNETGTVFRMDGAGNVSTLHSFSGADGSGSHAALIQTAEGTFYGATTAGSAYGSGAIFKMDSSGNVTRIHSNGIGAPPTSLEQGPDGNFYGTTLHSVFRMDSSGSATVIKSVAGSISVLGRGSDGNLYGTTSSSYQTGGCVFDGCHDGKNCCHGGVGVVYFGHLKPFGIIPATLFKIDSAGNLTTVHTFTGVGGSAALVQNADGTFYGTTSTSILKIDAAFKVTTLYNFGPASGAVSSLISGTDGMLYGTTSGGGAGGAGTAFRMDPSGTLATLYSFLNGDGTAPGAALVQADDGSFYGTMSNGGSHGVGTVFRLTSPGALTTLHSFNGADGAYPRGAVVQAADGNFYGTASQGGANGHGTVFKVDSSGTLTTLHSFDGSDGDSPLAALVEARDGNFYGTTSGGGESGLGTVFRITSSGDLTRLHSFDGSDGVKPSGPLVQTTAGDFFGVAQSNSSVLGHGTIFKMNSSGVVATIHSFGNFTPNAEIIQAANGNLYGTTDGTIFRVDPSDTFTTPVYFGGVKASLLQGADGNLYGTTSGTVFEMDLAGDLTTLHTFNGADGFGPTAALIQAADGSFYGTASEGGPLDQRVVFRLGLASLAVHSITPASGPATGGTPVTVLGGGFLNGASLSIGNNFATSVRVTDLTFLNASTPALPAGTLNDVAVTNPGSAPTSADSVLSRSYFADFLDVPQSHSFHRVIEGIFRTGITQGCGGGNYCASQEVSRAQIVMFLARAMAAGGANIPPSGTVGASAYACSSGGVSLFADVAPTDSFCKHVHYLASRKVDVSCDPSLFCPTQTVTRLPMASFVAEALVAPGGNSAVPETYTDSSTGLSYSCEAGSPNLHFADVPATSSFCRPVHYLWATGRDRGLRPDQFCPARRRHPRPDGQVPGQRVRTDARRAVADPRASRARRLRPGTRVPALPRFEAPAAVAQRPGRWAYFNPSTRTSSVEYRMWVQTQVLPSAENRIDEMAPPTPERSGGISFHSSRRPFRGSRR